MGKLKDVLTTGDVARICNVAPRTVSKWFDTGQLRGYRIPGSKDRRIPLAQLIRFMKAHGIPLDHLETGRPRILIVDADVDLARLLEKALEERFDYEVMVASSAFEAGALMEQCKPAVVLVDIDVPGIEGRVLFRFIAARGELQGTQVVAMGAAITDADRQSLLQQGYHNTIAKPFNVQQLAALVEESLAVGI
ncbi:MAG TPA: response regulator [Phycisphaerae bacterium]|nr:response regulator [Phycisphaerae bacterium]HRR84412.1 response regulator [Phycisphaerae bacterium]